MNFITICRSTGSENSGFGYYMQSFKGHIMILFLYDTLKNYLVITSLKEV